MCGGSGRFGAFFYAFVVDLDGGALFFLGYDFEDAPRLFAVQGFGASLFGFLVVFAGFAHRGLDLFVGEWFLFVDSASGAKVLVSLAHLAVGEAGRFAEHFVDEFVQFVDVSREGFAVLHLRHGERQRFQVLFEVDSAVFAGKHVLKRENIVAVLPFLEFGGFDGIVETDGVQNVPLRGPPDRR